MNDDLQDRKQCVTDTDIMVFLLLQWYSLAYGFDFFLTISYTFLLYSAKQSLP